jgi:hypothetical protein
VKAICTNQEREWLMQIIINMVHGQAMNNSHSQDNAFWTWEESSLLSPTICSMICGMDCIEVVRFLKIPKWESGAITLTCTQTIVTNAWFCVSNILEQNK